MVSSIAFAVAIIESAFKGIYFTHNFFEDVDLVEEHALLIFIHVRLAKNFDGALSSRLSVHAHTDLTEGTYEQSMDI